MKSSCYLHNISKAINFYETLDYKWVDTPWIVPQNIKQSTYPGLHEKCELGYLVGSAEQGFIQLMKEGKLPNGKYVSAGPCFRFDDFGKPGYHPYFFKVELIHVGKDDHLRLLDDARIWFEGDSYNRNIKTSVVKTEEGKDLYIGNIEVGSYGFRTFEDVSWSYGTGLAEPRYSEAKEKYLNER